MIIFFFCNGEHPLLGTEIEKFKMEAKRKIIFFFDYQKLSNWLLPERRKRKMIDGNLKCCLPSELELEWKGEEKESIRVVSLLLFLSLLTYQMMMSYCDAET